MSSEILEPRIIKFTNNTLTIPVHTSTNKLKDYVELIPKSKTTTEKILFYIYRSSIQNKYIKIIENIQTKEKTLIKDRKHISSPTGFNLKDLSKYGKIALYVDKNNNDFFYFKPNNIKIQLKKSIYDRLKKNNVSRFYRTNNKDSKKRLLSEWGKIGTLELEKKTPYFTPRTMTEHITNIKEKIKEYFKDHTLVSNDKITNNIINKLIVENKKKLEDLKNIITIYNILTKNGQIIKEEDNKEDNIDTYIKLINFVKKIIKYSEFY